MTGTPSAISETHAQGSLWAAMATGDLAFIRQTLLDNHPGAIDPAGTAFRDWLDEGYKIATGLVTEAANEVEAQSALARYVYGFADAHLGLDFAMIPKRFRWPGFTVGQRGNVVIVTEVEGVGRDLPQLGWELVSCDDRAPIDILVEEVLPYYDGRHSLTAVQVRRMPFVLAFGDTAGRQPIKTCRFATKDGECTLSLVWHDVDYERLHPRLVDAAFGHPLPLGMQTFAPECHWIAVPTFAPNGVDEAKMQAIIASVSELHSAKLVVFDLRGNTGGDSSWGYDIIRSLYGDAAAQAADRRAGGDSYAEWRVSADNMAYVAGMLPAWRRSFGPEAPSVKIFSTLVSDMQQALAHGQAFVRQKSDEGITNSTMPVPSTFDLVTGTCVVALTDGRCASACLDFLDMLLTFSNVMHLGQETAADTLYMDIRDVQLPSGLGLLYLPMKVYRNRARGHNEPLKPTHTYLGDIGNTKALQEWVIAVVRSKGP